MASRRLEICASVSISPSVDCERGPRVVADGGVGPFRRHNDVVWGGLHGEAGDVARRSGVRDGYMLAFQM
jgi:hypothetical protein